VHADALAIEGSSGSFLGIQLTTSISSSDGMLKIKEWLKEKF
jgi:hypothetical protein